ncbi:SF0329 family protein [Niastella populi]|uniref:SF0329 family protein n=1 Tax=Niastella populi TaxID=550983 RepID=UPI0013FE0D2B|nr:hypothetical protein [Niastella populi]
MKLSISRLLNPVKSIDVYITKPHPQFVKRHPAVQDEDRNPDLLVEEGEFSRFDLHNCCFEYLNLSVEEGLAHPSPLINLLAVLDRRLGKGRLPSLIEKKHHPLVKRFLKFRMTEEGFNINDNSE